MGIGLQLHSNLYYSHQTPPYPVTVVVPPQQPCPVLGRWTLLYFRFFCLVGLLVVLFVVRASALPVFQYICSLSSVPAVLNIVPRPSVLLPP